jgi:L-aminopeptidase/D-esterase-like protein
MTLTAVPGVQVGHWTDETALTGVTVMMFPEGNVAAVDVRGAAPGTREIALLAPGMAVAGIDALVFAGGSAFGLAAADGVVQELEQQGRGFPAPAGPVPIVPAAIIYDLLVGDPSVRPGPEAGAAAARAASADPVAMGNIGAGTGAAVGMWRGPDAKRKSGIGSYAVQLGDVVVGALAVVNAAGDVFTLEGESLTGGFSVPVDLPQATPGAHTTLVAVATNARFGRGHLGRVAVRAHDALAVCIRPVHTRFDGDIVFVIATGEAGDADEVAVAEAAFAVVGRSIEAAVRFAESAAGIPAIGQAGQ